MTSTQIEEFFNQEVSKKDFKKKSGLDKQIVYNYRHRKPISLGTMIETLLTLNVIEITKK